MLSTCQCTLRLAAAAELPAIRARWQSLWGDGLSLAQLAAEDAHLASTAFALSGSRRHYVLEAPGEADFVASCEVLLTPVAAGAAASAAPPHAWLVAFVFTPAELRGRGYASALITALRRAAAPAPLALFSDIGAELYNRLGFRATAPGNKAYDLVLPAAAAAAGAAASAAIADIPLRFDLSRLQLPAPALPPAAAALLLSPARLAWLCEAEAWRGAQGLLPGPLAARGAVLRGEGAPLADTNMGVCVWAADAARGDLVVLLLRAPSAAGLRALLARAQAVAAGARLQRVRVWDSADGAAERAVGLLRAWREARAGKLPMVAPAPGEPAGEWREPERGTWY